jgi:hypothetical protein
MDETLKLVIIILSIVSVVGGFIYWHFKTLHSFIDQVTDLKIQMKELENRDNLQQQTLDQLKELYPIIKTAIETLNSKKK